MKKLKMKKIIFFLVFLVFINTAIAEDELVLLISNAESNNTPCVDERVLLECGGEHCDFDVFFNTKKIAYRSDYNMSFRPPEEGTYKIVAQSNDGKQIVFLSLSNCPEPTTTTTSTISTTTITIPTTSTTTITTTTSVTTTTTIPTTTTSTTVTTTTIKEPETIEVEFPFSLTAISILLVVLIIAVILITH